MQDDAATPAEEAVSITYAWEQDTSIHAGLGLISRLLVGAESTVLGTKALHLHGLDPEVGAQDTKLSRIESILVMSGLQLLGLLAVPLRADLEPLISRLDEDSIPSQEEQAAIHAAAQRYANDYFGMADEVGKDVELAEEPPEPGEFDASSN